MREIPKKNYYILIAIIISTVIVTLGIAKIYINSTRETNEFYKYSNTIDSKEFKEYQLENNSYFIYISDKYSIEVRGFENDFKYKITEQDLLNKYIYMDKADLTKSVKDKINSMSETKINYKNYPLIIEVEENKITNVTYIDVNAYDIDTLLNYGELK